MFADPTSRRRGLRVTLGVITLAGLLVLPWCFESTYPPTLASRIRQSIVHVANTGERRFVVDIDKHVIHRFAGTSVYSRDDEGRGTIIGRIEQVGEGYELVIAPEYAERYQEGAVLRYSPPLRYFDEVLELICAPDGVEEELRLIQRDMAPTIEKEVIRELEHHLSEELRVLVDEFPETEKDRLNEILSTTVSGLEAETDELVDRLVNRAWSEIGVWGVTVGMARKLGEAAEDAYTGAKNAIRGLFEDEDEASSDESVDFLTDEAKKRLRVGMYEELELFWKDYGDVVVAKASNAFTAHEGAIVQRLKEEWLPRLYQKSVVRVWDSKRDVILRALSKAGARFASRRLATSEGELHLYLAYALRTVASITDRSLFVVEAREGVQSGVLKLEPIANIAFGRRN